ncbi:MAG: hypothetical protein EHM12_11100 [Dehalococcoidia bacterium]|nr:MAG: hypothetical protein EHM12_11100 [Dehalococcoidia bacterium]
MSGDININSVWKAISTMDINVNGGWRSVQSADINVNGEWRNWYSKPISGGSTTTSGIWHVINGMDDAYESSSVVNNSDTTIYLGRVGAGRPVVYTYYTAGFRFHSVRIPKGATIDSASIKFRSSNVFVSAAVIPIYGEAADNAADYSSGSITGRTTTTATTNWSPGNWSSGGWYNTPDIKTIVQEIIDRSGWSSGNPIAFVFSYNGGYRKPYAYEYGASSAATLYITYTYSGDLIPDTINRGIFAGGDNAGNNKNSIDYISISTTGNATDFGDLTIARDELAATSNGAYDRGVFGGGNDGSKSNTIDYINITITGNASDFGDLTIARNGLAATSNGPTNRGIFGGGKDVSEVRLNTIDYITISTTGNATDYGDLTIARNILAATSNGANNRGIFVGGDASGTTNVIDYRTISTTGNAADFGDLTRARWFLTATSNTLNDRGVFAGGNDYSNVIDYRTISTTGNASDFGDLSEDKERMAATSNGAYDRGVFGGGLATPSNAKLNVIEYITITSTSNTIDFGDLTIARNALAATSNS